MSHFFPLTFSLYMSCISLHDLTVLTAIVFCHLEIVSGLGGRGRRWNWVEICQTWWCSPTLLPHRRAWMKVKSKSSDNSTHKQIADCNLSLEGISSWLTHVSFQVLQVMFCHSVRPERNLWSITELNSSLVLTRGSCHGFIHQPIVSTRPTLTPNSTGTWAVSWVRHASVP